MDKARVAQQARRGNAPADLDLKVALLVHALVGVIEVFTTCQVKDPEAELAPVYELAVEIQKEVTR